METIEIDLKVGNETIRTKELSTQQFENLVYYIDNIDNMYYNVGILKNLKNNLVLTEEQKEKVIEDLQFVLDNIKDYDSINRADYYTLQILLSNIKYYESENNKQ